jgi:hypothetical protein
LGIIGVIYATSDFISLFIKQETVAKWALIIITLGGGLGWILVITQQKHFFGSVPLEFISPESFGFLAILGFPHLLFSRSLLLWGLTSYLRNEKGFLAGLAWLVMGFFQPLVVLIAWVITGVHVLFLLLDEFFDPKNKKRIGQHGLSQVIKKVTQAYIVSAPILIYTVWIYFTDPYLVGWLDQNILSSPHIIHYIFAYGLLLPFVFIGLSNLLLTNKPRALLILAWAVSLPPLIYYPINSQRRLAEGFWTILVIAALAFFNSKRVFSLRWKLYFLLAFPSSVILLVGAMSVANTPAKPAFRPELEINMYQNLGLHVISDQIVLSSFELGNNMPAWIPVRVVTGHGVETINQRSIELELKELFAGDIAKNEREAILDKYGIDYIVYGPIEQNEWIWSPEDDPLVDLVYYNQDYQIYKSSIGK